MGWATRVLGDTVPPGGESLARRLWATAAPGRAAVVGAVAWAPDGAEAPRDGPYDVIGTGFGPVPPVDGLATGGSLVLLALVGDVPPEVAALLEPWTVHHGTVVDIQRGLLDRGLRVNRCADETAALDDHLQRLKRRLLIARLGRYGQAAGGAAQVVDTTGVDLRDARQALTRAQACVADGRLQLVRIGASRGTPTVVEATLDALLAGCDPTTGCC